MVHISKAPPPHQQGVPPRKGLACILNPRTVTRPKNEERERGSYHSCLEAHRFDTLSKSHEQHPVTDPDTESASVSLAPPRAPGSHQTQDRAHTGRDTRRLKKGHSFIHVQSVKTQFCHRERNEFKSPEIICLLAHGVNLGGGRRDEPVPATRPNPLGSQVPSSSITGSLSMCPHRLP